MITQYGMGTELMSKQLPSDDYSMSDNTRRMIDDEMQYLTDLAHRRAMKLVADNRPLLEAFAFMLLENEVLEREDITRLVSTYRGQTRRGRRQAAGQGPRARSPGDAAVEAERPPRPPSNLRGHVRANRSRRRRRGGSR